jgi:hypothetical protein
MYSGFILYHFQYTARASFDATPTSATIIFNNTDDFVPVLPSAVQVAENPQQDYNTYTNIYCIHYLSFLCDALFMQTNNC